MRPSASATVPPGLYIAPSLSRLRRNGQPRLFTVLQNKTAFRFSKRNGTVCAALYAMKQIYAADDQYSYTRPAPQALGNGSTLLQDLNLKVRGRLPSLKACISDFKYYGHRIGGPRKDVARRMESFFPRCGLYRSLRVVLRRRAGIVRCRRRSRARANRSQPAGLQGCRRNDRSVRLMRNFYVRTQRNLAMRGSAANVLRSNVMPDFGASQIAWAPASLRRICQVC